MTIGVASCVMAGSRPGHLEAEADHRVKPGDDEETTHTRHPGGSRGPALDNERSASVSKLANNLVEQFQNLALRIGKERFRARDVG